MALLGSRFFWVAALWILAGCGGCGDDAAPPPDGAMMDAGPTDATVGIDARFGIPCDPEMPMDPACNDRVDCTVDVCDPLGFCRNSADGTFCSDDVFCNGLEICDPMRGGCRPAEAPESCNDFDVCTIDTCDEDRRSCLHGPRDFDEDGEADWHCAGGTDCDDGDPTRGAGSAEVCTDTIDNDCDEMIDEAACGRPAHDLCDDPLDVSAGGVFEVGTGGASADYMMGCGSIGWRDVVLFFTLDEPRDVRISAIGSITVTAAALRTVCDDRLTELECGSGFPGEVRRRNLAPATYYVIVSSSSPDEDMVVEVELTEPTPPPTNESCTMPLDVSAGGRFPGTLIDVRDDVTTACGFAPAPDLVYTFTTTAVQDISISAISDTRETLSFSVRRTCTDTTSELRCSRGSPAVGRLHEVPVGTYFLIVEGTPFGETDFTLDVQFLAPTPPPPGDICSNAIPLTLGTRTLGTLLDKEDDVQLTCASYYRDAIYSFTITEPSDVVVELDAGGGYLFGAVQSTCGDRATELRCSSGAPATLPRLRNLPMGTYFVVVESFSGMSFNITVTASPPTVPIRVTGNDNCATAYDVPVTGGLFSGNTNTAMMNYRTALCGAGADSKDVVFRLELPTMRRVIATTDGSTFDTVLHRHGATCTSMAELACDDSGRMGVGDVLTATLPAGTHHFVVDGFGFGNEGEYTFEVRVTDP